MPKYQQQTWSIPPRAMPTTSKSSQAPTAFVSAAARTTTRNWTSPGALDGISLW